MIDPRFTLELTSKKGEEILYLGNPLKIIKK